MAGELKRLADMVKDGDRWMYLPTPEQCEAVQELVEAARKHREYANRKQGAFKWVCECDLCKALAKLEQSDTVEPKRKVEKVFETWVNVYPDGSMHFHSSQVYADSRAEINRLGPAEHVVIKRMVEK